MHPAWLGMVVHKKKAPPFGGAHFFAELALGMDPSTSLRAGSRGRPSPHGLC